ncbi:hypothetical protein V5740_01205 [Croceibacterium sp. TMG7-5b_MA50]|uniref:hypothetical protein n=1 Tax=Croceibacterium sp. TMG7-5b_MA50 TaxID=3121290 RepID=UPI003221C7BA
MADLIAGTATPHWARALLERTHILHPLATLTAEELAPFDQLLIAQPRVLSPGENVALDAWVRDGGRLLLLADPLLTAESHYALGDPRRPQDVVLLSPLLTHWGLQLRFDPDQPSTPQMREIAGLLLPYHMAGEFAPLGTAAECARQTSGIIAERSIGRGHVLIVADAALVDASHPDPAAADALSALVSRAFDDGVKSLSNKDARGAAAQDSVDKSVENAP